MKPDATVLLVLLCLFVTCETKRKGGPWKHESESENEDGPWWMHEFICEIRDELAAQKDALNASITAQIAAQHELKASITGELAAQVAAINVSLNDQLSAQQREIEASLTGELAAQVAALNANFTVQLATQQSEIEASLSDQLATQQSVMEASVTAAIAAQVDALYFSLTDQIGGSATCNTADPSLPRDCEDIYKMGSTTTGEHTIYPDNTDHFAVRCDMDTPNGGWTVIQRRVSDSDFYRGWSEYETGFGNLATNFWLGLRQIHAITSQDEYSLRVDMTYGSETAFAIYHSFDVGNAESEYRLFVDGYSGTAGDSLRKHNGNKFTTKDRENDFFNYGNCAKIYHGAWWYFNCHESNLNGEYGSSQFGEGISWGTFKDYYTSLTAVEMKVKRYTPDV